MSVLLGTRENTCCRERISLDVSQGSILRVLIAVVFRTLIVVGFHWISVEAANWGFAMGGWWGVSPDRIDIG